MPTLNISSIGQTGAQWYISDLGFPWTSAQYSRAYIYVGGITSSPVYPPTSGSSYSTSWGSISGLSPGTTYSARGYVVTPSGITYDGGSTTFTTTSPPSRPIGTPVVSASATSGGANISWYGVSGANGYNIYADDYYKTSTASNSAFISLDKEYWNYSIKVIPYNGAGDGSTGYASVRTYDSTSPTLTNFYATELGTYSIKVYASGYDNMPSSGNMSGLSGFYFYLNNNYSGVAYQSNGEAYYTFTGLNADTVYTIGCRAFDNSSNQTSMSSYDIRTKSARPTNFSWTYAKNAGDNFYVGANEWNALTAKINEFRIYKKLPVYSFSEAGSSGIFYAWIFNQAVDAINAMSPPTAVPSSQGSGGTITASILNGLVNSLNSIA